MKTTHTLTQRFIELNIEQRIEFRIQTEISQLFSYAVVVIEDTAYLKYNQIILSNFYTQKVFGIRFYFCCLVFCYFVIIEFNKFVFICCKWLLLIWIGQTFCVDLHLVYYYTFQRRGKHAKLFVYNCTFLLVCRLTCYRHLTLLLFFK